MGNTAKKNFREGFNRLKKVLEKIIKQKDKQPMPALAWQRVRRNNF
jgi:hypothetical protein